jgi:hypothetical protein
MVKIEVGKTYKFDFDYRTCCLKRHIGHKNINFILTNRKSPTNDYIHTIPPTLCEKYKQIVNWDCNFIEGTVAGIIHGFSYVAIVLYNNKTLKFY